MFKIIVTIGVALAILSSCAVTREGEVDYVRTVSGQATKSTNEYEKCEDYDKSVDHYQAGFTRNCYESLYRKYTTVDEIKTGETVSVHMMQGFIEDGLEAWSPLTDAHSSVNAEIVIIANVCEQGKKGCSQKFGPVPDKTGRVIFFSNGVKAKQYLNFSYLPVYGPIRYDGGALIVQLTIMELDDLSEKQIALIESLSNAGKKAYPPASQALSLLDTLGKSILQGSQNDILFRYSMSLTPKSGDKYYQNPVIAEGNYAFVRKDTVAVDQEDNIWSEIKFDNLTGRLIKKCNDEDINTYTIDESGAQFLDTSKTSCSKEGSATGENGYKDYRDNTYLTFQIKSGLAERSLDSLQTVEEFLSELNAEKNKNAEYIINATEKLGLELTKNLNEEQIFSHLKELSNDYSKVQENGINDFKSSMYQFLSTYEKQLQLFKDNDCISKQKSDACSKSTSKDTLVKIGIELQSIFGLTSDQLSPFKLDETLTKVNDSLSADLLTSYKLNYQKTITSQFKGDLNSLDSLKFKTIKIIKESKDRKKLKAAKKEFAGKTINYLNDYMKLYKIIIDNKCVSGIANDCYKTMSKNIFPEMTKKTLEFLDAVKTDIKITKINVVKDNDGTCVSQQLSDKKILNIKKILGEWLSS